MKNIRIGPIIKLLMGVAAAVLLTVAFYFGIINVALSVAPAQLWHKEAQKLVLVTEGYELQQSADLFFVKEKDLSKAEKEALEQLKQQYDPETTNLRYTIRQGEKVAYSTYKDEAVLAETTRWDNVFVGTDQQLEQIEIYERWYHHNRYTDPETGVTMSRHDYQASVRPTPVPTPSPTPMPVWEEGDEPDIPPTPPVDYGSRTENVINMEDAISDEELIPPDVISHEEYNKLQETCYEARIVELYVLQDMQADDFYHELYLFMERIILSARDSYGSMLLCLCAGLLLTLLLMVTSGKRNEEGLYVASGTGVLPWDVWLVLWCCIVVGVGIGAFCMVVVPMQMVFEGISYYEQGAMQIYRGDGLALLQYAAIGAIFLCTALGVGSLHSIAARIKVKGWWRNFLCRKIFLWCWSWCVKLLGWCRKVCKAVWTALAGTAKAVPMIWKAVLVLGAIAFVEIIYVCANVYNGSAVVAVLWNIVKLVLCIIVVLMLKRLHDGAKVIADGDLDHRIDLKHMYGELKTHAEYLNRIGDGLSRSVDSQLRSERMKTELITNVSHDLKTPLTSIVNYVDLLKKEALTGTAGEYVEVLDRQSARLKKLTEDLVEASKASSGALNVTVERVNLNELMEQVQAEYGERLSEAMLTPISRLPKGKVEVWADGKYVWRILDNLLGNVCKYAMPGTRVYLELTVQEDKAVMSVKNMSRESLNISAEELMERFVRGDASRNTEGSGLGLSIAQNLAKLMGGELKLTVDGDLFKADVILPMAK